jgi:ATP:ADP antiporter, AAA family
MVSDGDDDPWDFLAARKSEVAGREPAASDAVAPEPVRRERGEIRAEMAGPTLKRRAWPLAAALIAVSFAGFLTEVVGASQMIALAGPSSLIYMYPLGGLGLIAVALLQFRFVDHRARLPMLRAVGIGYAAVFTVAIVFISLSVWQVAATGAVWLLADQLNFLVPLLVWSLAGDEFNVAEGRKIFGWIVAWTYLGQLAGLAVSAFAPLAMDPLGIPLWALLVLNPVVCVFMAVWLPRRLRHTAAAKGTAKDENLRESLAGAWEFINGVKVWRTLLIASLITFASTMTAHLAFLSGVGTILGSDASALQVLIGSVTFGVFILCWLIQKLAARRVQDRLGIPGTLLILPIAAVLAGLVLAVGSAMGSIAVLVVGIALVRIPRWTVDENTRRAALALVPDERRARVSFFVDLGPIALGLIIAGPIGLIGVVFGIAWVVPLIAAVIAAFAIRPSISVVRGWDDSLMNWRLRRRKQNRTLDFS